MKRNTINFTTLKKLVDKNSNDGDLGGEIRKIYWEVINENDEGEKGRNF